MAASADTWLREFGEAMKLAEEVLSKVQEKNEMVKSGEDISRLVSASRRKLNVLSSKADRLENLLQSAPDRVRISEREARRREDMLLGIRYKIKQMSAQLSANQQANRNALIGDGGSVHPAVETERTANLDSRGVVNLQKQMMQDQDEELATLESTVSSTKHIAIAINEELGLQKGLLDEMDQDVESTNNRMKVAQTKLLLITKRGSGVCGWLYILLLFAGIALVIYVLAQILKWF
eukprot:jgi/Mesen1/5873/ME000299S05000